MSFLTENSLSKIYSNKTVYIVIAFITVILVGLMLLGMFGMETISGLRSFVGAEGLWSKSQKSAVINIFKYASSHDEHHYEMFKKNLEVQAGHKQARLELEKEVPDLERVYNGLIQGGNHHLDVENMALLFSWFRDFEHIDRAIKIWEQGDGQIAALEIQAKKASPIHFQKEVKFLKKI